MKGKRPDYTVSTVVQTDNGDRWREIGVAFASDKGGTITAQRNERSPQRLRSFSPFPAAGRDPARRRRRSPRPEGRTVPARALRSAGAAIAKRVDALVVKHVLGVCNAV